MAEEDRTPIVNEIYANNYISSLDVQNPANNYEASQGFEITPGQVKIPVTKDKSFSFKKLWAFTGPGFLMSIAYLDPGNIESDLQAGAIAKYKLIWVLMWSTVLGLILQLLAARLGCVTGMNLAQVCHLEYPMFPRITLWLMVEIAIVGSDIQEVIGSAIALNLLSNHKIPIWAGVLITGVDTFTFLFLESAGLRKLEAFFGALITTMAVTFLYIYVKIMPNQGDILIGMWFPWCENCDKDSIVQLVGIVGAVIMPHNIYLHSALVLTRNIDRTNKHEVAEAIKYNSIESAIALFVSFIINLFVLAVFAAAFSGPTFREEASLHNAASTLYLYIFSMGFMNIRWSKWKRVLLTRSIAMVPTIIVALIATNDLDAMNNWLNVLQSVQLPFALLPVLHFTSSETIMREFKNGRVMKITVWGLAILVMGINFYLVIISVGSGNQWWIYVIAVIVIFVYLAYVAYIAIGPHTVLKLKMMIALKFNRDTEKILNEIERRETLKYTTREDLSNTAS
ncbi:DMT1 [Mytilus edulis]|uniref:SLC11A2 n=1 Tax=Mytilus edulis TaxID=6550 RepID=A0A8S3PSW2_MYTED|nr:DMT1 [Mytilus edulis]